MQPGIFVWATAILCAVALFRTVFGHVALTFPPARKYALDFLDNVRTRPPCGVPKGDIATSLPIGVVLNVTWKLAYPHLGGFKLELLDKNEKKISDLTPQFVGSEQITTQHYTVHLPAGKACRGCTIRLVRQALDWGPQYNLWSCADVDILPVEEFTKICSGRGMVEHGKDGCICHKPYSGIVCQYEEECWNNEDCGHGRCIDMGEGVYPQRQCYCEFGWHGYRCSKESSVKTPNINLNLYTRRDLSNEFQFFWRIVQETAEIEAVLHLKGVSYAAIGWRPQGISMSCKAFPLIFDRRASPRNLEDDTEDYTDYVSVTSTQKSLPTTTDELNPTSISDVEEIKEAENISTKYSSKSDEQPDTFDYQLIPKEVTTEFTELVKEPETEDLDAQPAMVNVSQKYRQKRQITFIDAPKLAPDNNLSTTLPPEARMENDDSSRESKRTKLIIHKYPARSAYTPKGDFHPMDCSDIVIGSAKGNLSRVLDYYTRDRSTPLLDEEYGGQNDITAAFGFEINGVTTIVFRKKLKAMELTDHPIINGPMEVIWAKGQESQAYSHRPPVETMARLGEFYKPDQLKYHGHGSQRGKTVINFYDERKPVVMEETKVPLMCVGEWKYPEECEDDCEYKVIWRFNSQTDEVMFTITTKYTDKWTGIAFSKGARMIDSDAIIGWVDHIGRPILLDMYIDSYAPPKLDQSQDIYNISGYKRDGYTTLQFIRKRMTSDERTDIQFLDDDCPYFLFPVKGGTFNAINKKIARHQHTPMISSSKICIQSCLRPTSDPNTPKLTTTTVEPKESPTPSTTPITTFIQTQPPETTTAPLTKETPTITKIKTNNGEKPIVEIKYVNPPEPETTSTTTQMPMTQATRFYAPSTTQKVHSYSEPKKLCSGEWRYPKRCQLPDCQYVATWNYRDETDDILFRITTKSFSKWTGIGFSENKAMAASDAVIGWALESGQFFLFDGWLEGYTLPLLDPSQDIYNYSGSKNDGLTTIQFYRKRDSNDLEHDLHFSDTRCLYLIFPIEGGLYNAVNKKIRKHESTPHFSDEKVCIRSCSSERKTTLKTSSTAHTTVPPSSIRTRPSFVPSDSTSKPFSTSGISLLQHYNVHIKVPQNWEMEYAQHDSTLYKKFLNSLETNLSGLLNDIYGFEEARVKKFEEAEDETILVEYSVAINHPTKNPPPHEKLQVLLESAIHSGRIGDLNVDPSFLTINPYTVIQLASDGPTNKIEDSKEAGISDEQLKTYFIIGGVSTLIFLVVLQALWMFCIRSKKKPVKEKAPVSSQWKDFSVTASSNYSYENFAMQDDESKVSKHPVGSVSNGSLHSKAGKEVRPMTGPGGRFYSERPPIGYSATLERPGRLREPSQFQGSSNAYATHDRSGRSNGYQQKNSRQSTELRPDFYFMPHQRRYSGEVVRVYVDYNNPEYKEN